MDALSNRKPNLPPHPLGYRCDGCKHWLRELAQDYFLGPNGQAVPVKAALAAGMARAGDAAPKVKSAPCTFMPVWTQQPAEMYCWQFKPQGHSLDELNAPLREFPKEQKRQCRICGGEHYPHETC